MDVHRPILSAQIQKNAAKLIRASQHKWKMTQSNSRVSEGEEMEDSSIAKPVS